ncbi:MAG: TrbI/VirB10 family protein [Candidatus Omnitrophica bacterium]|nr:TrbI/VirB10 family protein [Candidatus Omnitrophota bacterium]MCA9409535.1 TrbI/VirB10 family protein [Candidatus Omnitrophota bacterium]
MKIVDYLFKKDHTGQRKPTLVFIFVLVLLVFGSYFLSGNEGDKDSEKVASDPVINNRDVRSIGSDYKSNTKQEDLIKPLLFSNSLEKGASKEKVSKRHLFKKKDEVNSVVYDNTRESQIKEREVKVPLGSMIQCLLVHNIITNNFSSPVIVQVKKDFYFNGRLLFPQDTRIFGEARAGRERDRVLVAFRTVLFEDGYEVNLKGRGLNFDGSGGFKAQIITEKNKEKIFSKIMHFLSGTLLGLQEKSTNALTGINQLDVNSRNAILEGSAKSLSEEAKRMEIEINESKGYGIVPAGTDVILYIDESFNLTQKAFR